MDRVSESHLRKLEIPMANGKDMGRCVVIEHGDDGWEQGRYI